MKLRYLFFYILYLTANFLMAQPPLSDSAKISLMTCAPWSGAVYALYGHTAVWVKDDSTHTDVVFNYGFFDSSQPNFIYHFVRGETDYVLGVTSFEDFISEYRSKGVSVWEQPLNLSQGEKQTLWKALYINSLPENRSYRYNFLYDNCATRPRDMVEKYVEGKIIYPKTRDNQTYRNLLHECLHPYPWMEFGIDLIIGAPADRKIDERDKMFLPEYLMRAFEGAIVKKNDTLRYPLVQQTRVILTSNNAAKVSEHSIFTPLNMAFALLLITLLLSIIQVNNINNGFPIKVFDTLLFGMVGLGGTIVFFLMYFSEHPATNPNWNFVWLNIISLLIAVLFWIKSAEKVVHIYHFINFAALTLFLFFWWLIPQQLPVASIPISLCLWVRSGVNMWLIRKEKQKQKKYTSAKYLKAGWGQ